MIARALLLALLLGAGTAAAAETHTVTDMAGRAVILPVKPEGVACLEVLCYQKMFMLGAAGQVREMTQTIAPWMQATNPAVVDIPKITVDPNFEDLLARRTDVVFYAYNAVSTLAKLDSIGLPGLVSQPQGHPADTADVFIAESKRAVRMFGAVLGGEAVRRADEWCDYFDAKLRFVTSRVAAIPPEQRRKLYYLRGPSALDTQGSGSNTFWFGTLAGADMVVKDQSWMGKGMVSMEDILRWNPDFILVGRQYSPDLVLTDDRWAGVAAVRNGRVIPSPEGVFYWDGGLEGVLLMEFLAKQLYPERFADLDPVVELKEFYRRFYRYPLTDAEAALLLQGRSPDGRRQNLMNN